MSSGDPPEGATRKNGLKKVPFVPPIIVTLPAGAAFARNGSGRSQGQHGRQGQPKPEQQA